MKRTRKIAGAAALAASLLAAGTPAAALACGYHDARVLARGMLSWSYPDALHVTGAAWSGQQAGVLAMPDPVRLQARGEARARLDEEAFQRAIRALHALGAGLDGVDTPSGGPDLAIVLIEPMLWTRYVPSGGGVEVVSHAKGPKVDDLVIVTDEPVLHAIHAGMLSVAEARRQGFLRLYGTPEQEREFLDAYAGLGEKPLPAVSLRSAPPEDEKKAPAG